MPPELGVGPRRPDMGRGGYPIVSHLRADPAVKPSIVKQPHLAFQTVEWVQCLHRIFRCHSLWRATFETRRSMST